MGLTRALLIGWLGAVLGACSTPGPGPQRLPPPAQHPAAPADPVAAWRLDQQDRARALEAQGELADALLLRDALVLLDPADGPARAERDRLRALIEHRVAELMRRAPPPERRADWAAAELIYLSVLALQSQHPEAARALRSLEQRRTPRSSRLEFGVPADPRLPGETRPTATMPPSLSSSPSPMPPPVPLPNLPNLPKGPRPLP